MYDRVWAVERSDQMLRQLPERDGLERLRVGDLEQGAADLRAGVQPDLIVSLATLHHLVERGQDGGGPDAGASRELQARTIAAWVRRLRPGGRLVLVDVGRRAGGDPAEYLWNAADRLARANAPAVSEFEVKQLDHDLPEYGFRDALDVIGYPHSELTLQRLAATYANATADFPLTADGPIKHFDVTVTENSIEGHDAYFWSEPELADSLSEAGLADVAVAALPTPWLFLDQLGAYWFINELFGLNVDPDQGSSTPTPLEIIGRYLTVRSGEAHAIVDWQLLYATGVKRGPGEPAPAESSAA
jgi:SAM-dependent methyltransferase